MKHPSIEFKTACSCCLTNAEMVSDMAKEYPEVEVKVYYAGKDVDYIPKYGALTESLMVINESDGVKGFSEKVIRNAFEKAIKTA